MEKFYLKKRCKPLITTLLLMTAMGGFKSKAQVTIAPATGGTNICANKAVGGSDASFTALGPITISESLINDFPGGTGVIVVVSAPTGWQFNTSVTPTVVYAPGADINDALVASHTSSTIQIAVTTASALALDALTISGLEVQATSSGAAPSAITGFSAAVNGLGTATNIGTLSLTSAVTPSVSIAATPAGAICAGTNVDFTPTMSDTGSAPTYQWQVNSGVVSIASTYSSTMLNNGDMVSLVVTATPGGCYTSPTATSNTIVMTVNPLPAKYNVTGGGNFCPGGAGVNVSIANSDLGIDYQLYINGVASGSPMPGTGTAISFGLQTTIGSYNVLGTNTTTSCSDSMNGPVTVGNYALPTVYNVTGGGTGCSNVGVDVSLDGSELGVDYQLYNGSTAVGTPVAGTGAGFSFGMQMTAGTYSVNATSTLTTCVNNMAGTQAVVIDPAPVVFTMTGGGNYCAGGTGLAIGLDSSETGVDYQLYMGATPIGSPVAGTGFPFSFGTFTAAGTYTVQATNSTTSCTSDMADEASILINPLPTVYNVTGGGAECPGGAGFDVSIDNSDFGISYQLYNGATAVGAPVAGTGAGFSFGMFTTAGTYTVLAIDNTTACTNAMNSSAVVTIYPAPTVFNVIGGGAYCIGGAGVTVDLDSSEVGVQYTLFYGSAPTGTVITGTGSPISFGLRTAAGDYTVVAMELTNACVSDMNDTATVIVNPLPVVYNVTGGGAYCAGGTGIAVGLDNSETGVSYQLYVGGTTTGTPVAGTGTAISFGPQTVAGTYTVAAMNTATTCVNDMASSALVTITSTVAPSVSMTSTALDTICAGTNITFTATPVNGGALPAFAWSVNGVATGTGPTYSYIPSNGDIVKTVLTSSAVCPSPDTAVAVMTMTVTPMSTPTVAVNISPNDTVCDSTFLTMTATSAFGGPSAAITWLRNGIAVGTGSTYSYFPTNNDIIFTTLSSDYRCRTSSLVFSVPKIISVVAPVIPTVSLTIQPGVIIGHGESDTLIANVTNGGSNPKYQWYSNGTAIPGATNAMYVSNGFQHKDSISVRVHRDDACALVNFNSVILSVGVGVNDVIFANSDISVVPNPSTGTFSIKGSVNAVNDPQIAVEITNMLGQVVYSKTVVAKQGMVNAEISLDNSIANGTYLMSMKSGADKKVVRLVVEH